MTVERDARGHFLGCYTVGCAATRCQDCRKFWEKTKATTSNKQCESCGSYIGSNNAGAK